MAQEVSERMADGPVERNEERKRVTNIYCYFRVVGEKKWGFLKPDPKRGLVVNMSRTGMGVRVTEPVEVGRMLEVEMKLPHHRGEPLQLRAEVLWVRAQRKLGTVTYTHIFGAHFTEYSPEAWQAIQDFIEQ